MFYTRLQGFQWRQKKDSLRLVRYMKNRNGNIRGEFKGENGARFSHWLNDKEKETLRDMAKRGLVKIHLNKQEKK